MAQFILTRNNLGILGIKINCIFNNINYGNFANCKYINSQKNTASKKEFTSVVNNNSDFR